MAFETLDILLKKEGILAGSSAGTLVAGAIEWCRAQTEPKRVVTLICDTGNKYLSKAFDDAWLTNNGLDNRNLKNDLSDLIVMRSDQGQVVSVKKDDTIATAYNRMRNSNISQLSGGEKALTALSLVFALFKLNPAPFCMLDEVDAPLDDLNTTRFVNMVESMSPEVQFIFITHNKISMEKSDHLMGITMQEAGVSRVVSVDVSEALELAAS